MSGHDKFHLGKQIRQLQIDQLLHENENKAWVNAVNSKHETPLHIAAKIGNLKLFKSLLPHYSNIEAVDDQGNTVLHVLADSFVSKNKDFKFGRINLFCILVSKGANVNKPNKLGWTPIHYAAKYFQIDMLKLAEMAKANFNLKTISGETALLLACKNMLEVDDFSEVIKTINFFTKRGCTINSSDDKGYSALHYAVEKCNIPAVNLLLEKGANIHLRTKKHKLTPLHFAVRRSNLPLLEILLQADAKIESPEIDELTPLQMSIFRASIDVIKFLIDNGANVNYPDKTLKFTPLHLAICQQRIDVFQLLLENQADINVKVKESFTPLHISSMLGSFEFTKALIDLGVDVNCRSNKHQFTPLHLATIKTYLLENSELIGTKAIGYGNETSLVVKMITHYHSEIKEDYQAVIQLLLRNGAHVNALTSNGWSSLHFAAKLNRHPEIFVKILLDHGANVYLKEFDSGFTALHFATANNYVTIAELFMRADADVDALTPRGKRPIHLALRENCTSILKLFVQHKVDVNCEEPRTKLTPLHITLIKNFRKAAEILINSGADVDYLTPDGKSPMHLAVEMNYLDVVILLIQRGANINHKEPQIEATPLHLALKNLHEEIAVILMNAGANVNNLTLDGKSPLHLILDSMRLESFHQTSIELLALISSSGADVNCLEPTTLLSPLHIVLNAKQYEAAFILIKAGADVNSLNHEEKSPLHLVLEAMRSKSFDPMLKQVFKLLVDHGANVNYIEPTSQLTPLHLAFEANQSVAAAILINAGANVNFLTPDGKSPLHLALEAMRFKRMDETLTNVLSLMLSRGVDINQEQHSNLESNYKLLTNILKMMIEHGADVNYLEPRSQLSPLHMALDARHSDEAQILIEAGADVNAWTPDGRRPIHMALSLDGTTVLKLLIEYGADIDCKEMQTLLTPLHLAFYSNYEDIAMFLINAGADINALTPDGKKAIHLAASADFERVMNLFIERGVDLDCKENETQLTPLHLALQKNKHDVAKHLIMGGANVHILNQDGKSPLHYALEHDKKQIIKCLMRTSAKLHCKSRRCLYTLLYFATLSNATDALDKVKDLDETKFVSGLNSEDCEKEIKTAIFRLAAIVDARNEKSCLPVNPIVKKFCDQNDDCLDMCNVHYNDYQTHNKFLIYRVLSYDLGEFNNIYNDKEQLWKHLDNYMYMLKIVKLPFTVDYNPINPYNEYMNRYYGSDCKKEVEQMKNLSINDTITLYDVLHMKPRRRRTFTKSLDMLTIKEEFQIYYKLILTYYMEDKVKSKLVDSFQWAFFKLTNFDLSIPFLDELFWDLSIIDIISMIQAAEGMD